MKKKKDQLHEKVLGNKSSLKSVYKSDIDTKHNTLTNTETIYVCETNRGAKERTRTWNEDVQ